jgi:hypothetical protein
MPYFPIGHVLLDRESAVCLKVWFAVVIGRDSTRKSRPGGSAFSFLITACLARSERLLAPLTPVHDASDAGHDLMRHPGEATAPAADRPASSTRSAMAVCARRSSRAVARASSALKQARACP